MPKPAGLKVAAVTCVALVSACSSPQQPTSTPGTTPSVWTGSPAPSTSGHQEALPSPQAGAAAQMLMTVLKGPDGKEIATAKFEFANGYATVTVATTGTGVLSPGFHGMHLHKVGKCEANSVAPNGGAPGDFLSAGGHLQLPGASGHASGDLPPLQVRKDGSGTLVTTTDAFTMDDLTSGAKTAIIIHAGADNFANIPADRYKQNDGTPGPDETTMTTGDAGKRVACGVIGSG
ncbi:superoxide dismutase[Cu-Zn] [Mycobacterium sp. 23]|uniref:superoxide dismutase[Cu-Zn] n=1 Tax=Mycobacterium sp. 23 TaxID=3400424 RepID=UPI003AAAE24D